MLGPPKTRDHDRPVLVAVESYVPKGHFYRHLHHLLDLSFVRDLAAHPSIPRSSSGCNC